MPVELQVLQAHGLQNEHHNGQDDDGDDGKPGQELNLG